MAQLLGGSYSGLIIVAIAVAITLKLYTTKRGVMIAKCPKSTFLFDISRTFSVFHIGCIKQLKCPACGKVSLMNAYVKDAVTWPLKAETEQPTEYQLTDEFEKKRIEDSKYEKA